MLTLCKTTVQTLLGISDHPTERRNHPYRCRNIHSPEADGLRLLAGDTLKPPNIVESSAVGPPGKPPQRTDLGARGLHDLDHRNLRLCTENLGSESCDDGGMGMEDIGGRPTEEDDRRLEARPRRWRTEAKFPPPLPWLTGRDGRRSRFMRVVRVDGRIVLTEVRIERPEVLRASRHDGRLRLELVGDANLPAMISNQEEEEDEDEIEEEEPAVAEEDEKEEEEEEEESAAAAAEATRVKSEGARCVEALGGNGIPPWWSHRFVTTA